METLRRNWWMLASQGFFLALIAAYTMLRPQFALADLLHYFALILLAFGLLLFLVGLIKRGHSKNWWGLAFFGLVQGLAGTVILLKPQQSLSVFIYIVGAFAFLIGISQLVIGLGKKKRRKLFFISGVLSLLLSLLILFNPWSEAWSNQYLIGIYTLILGAFLVYFGFQAKKVPVQESTTAEATPANQDHLEEKREGTDQ